MKQQEAEELLCCLPGGRTLFTYGKDWYAISLLKLALRDKAAEQLRKSTLGNLFEKPRLRAWLGSLGKKSFTKEDLNLLWPDETETYRLTAGLFDGWTQTSRKGSSAWNIVLQMNLNEEDARLMDRKFPERRSDPFEYRWHPVHEGRHRTLAWARIDLDWDSGEALIEEIQNDRLREVRRVVGWIERRKDRKHVKLDGQLVESAFVLDYWERRLRFSRQCWDEAMLSAAIGFIADELGIRRIFYHSPASAERLKGKSAAGAPSSVYTDLPRRFCFERTDDMPSFLKAGKSRRKGLWMHRLVL